MEGLYEAFAGVAKPLGMQGCPCCITPEEIAELLRPPLRSMDAEQLDQYLRSAMHTVGTAEDFRYFAPRVLELVVSGDLKHLDIEIALGRLGAAGWTSWSEAERTAVGEVLDAFWDASLACFTTAYSIDEILCALSGAVADLTSFLDRWTAALDGGSAAAAQHLAEFVEANAAVLFKRRGTRLANAFWQRAAVPQVVAWLRSAGLRAAVEAAFHRACSSEAEAEVEAGIEAAAEVALDLADRYLGMFASDAWDAAEGAG
ncbi:hypothetical protein [Streptacidiphilus sp. PAMC 29251]